MFADNRHEIIVADSGPLIVLAIAKLLPSCSQALGPLLVPKAVLDECSLNLDSPSASAIQLALESGQLIEVQEQDIEVLDIAYQRGLGSGEIAVLNYAKLHQHIALIDERRARRIAKQIDVPVIGTGAVLISLKREGLLASIKPTLELWARHGYYLSDEVTRSILTQASE